MNHKQRRAAVGYGRPWWKWRALRRTRNQELVLATSDYGFQVRDVSRASHAQRYGSRREGRGIAGYRQYE
jgi:hypothetical protein